MDDTGRLLAEQVAYYRAGAPDYLDAVLPWSAAQDELQAAIDGFRPTGDVLELACGPGTWTPHLLGHAASVTAVDASPEMLALAADRVGAGRVSFIQADLFEWEPDRAYDSVFFGFWLSHVPLDRFPAFWSMVDRRWLRVARSSSSTTTSGNRTNWSRALSPRRSSAGTTHRIVKVPHQARDLQDRLDRLGWRITVTPTSGPFYWGTGAASLTGLSVQGNRREGG